MTAPLRDWLGRIIGTTGTEVVTDAEWRPRALDKLFVALSLRKLTPCRIAFVGSSSTQGSNATTATNRWVDQLVARFQATFPSGGTESAVVASTAASFGALSTAPGVHGYNAGIGNTTSADYLTTAKVAAIAALNPAAVFHMIGSNDLANAVPPATYQANVQGWVTALKTAVPVPLVQILVHSYQRMDVPVSGFPWTSYRDALQAIAAADPDHVVFLDLSDDYAMVGVPAGIPRPVAAGGTIAADNLRRAASTLGAAQSGQPWTADGTWSTTTSGASCTAGNGLAYVDVGTGDMDVSATVGITSGAGAFGLLLNAADFNNRLVYYLNAGAGTWNLGKFDASGAIAGLASGSGVTTGAGTSHVLRAVSSDAVITLYVDGAQVGTYTLTAPEQTKFKALTKAGLRHNPAVVGTLADFTVKAVKAGTVTVVDPLNLVDADNLHQTDAGHAFMATQLARELGVLTA